VKHVARDQYEVGTQRDDLLYGALKRARNVRLTLIDPSRSETLVLTIPEVKIREMDEAHAL